METTYPSLPEVDSDPLSDMVLDYLIDLDQEEPFLDFKMTINLGKDSDFPEIAKDLLAFANYGGGIILIGFRDRAFSKDEKEKSFPRRYIPIGLPNDFQLDQANLQSKFDSFCVHPLALRYREFKKVVERDERRFAAISIPPSTELMKAFKGGKYRSSDGRTHTPFEVGNILFRHGTQSKPATEGEKEFILQRVKIAQYKLSVLNGQPDRIEETIYSNLFETRTDQVKVFSAKSRDSFWNADTSRQLRDYVSVLWNNRDITFENISDIRNPLWQSVRTETISADNLQDWLEDDGRRKVIERLLNQELRHLAWQTGLRKDPDRYRYYFPCPGDSVTVNWKPRFKESSSLVVAKKTFLPKLHKQVCVHYSVGARFVFIERRIYLRLSPGLVLTSDGLEPLTGQQIGPQITSLLHNRYNQTYLNNLLFWIFQFSGGKPEISLAHGAILVDSTPASALVRAGILADIPTAEEIPKLITEEQS